MPRGNSLTHGRKGRVAGGAVLFLASLALSCGEEIVVRTDTRVYADGGVARRVEVAGREPDGTQPTEAQWLAATAGVRLADRNAWTHVDETIGGLSAEGFFPPGASIPPTLAHPGPAGDIADKTSISLKREDLAIATRWTWRESTGDPFGEADTAKALDTLAALASKAVEQEIGRTLGPDVDASAAGRFLRGDARKLVAELLPSVRAGLARGGATQGAAKDAWRKVLARYGVPVAGGEAILLSEEQIGKMLEWTRARTARALSTKHRTIAAEELSFWPGGGEAEAQAGELIERVWGSQEAFDAEAGSALDALGGYYGREGSPRFRFEARVALPGRLLGGNGMPDQDALVWLYRDESLALAAREMTARSLELAEEPLRRLGARREFDAAELLRITDLLGEQDASPDLLALLRSAIDRGDLAMLRDEDAIADELEPLARELADLLDPAIGAVKGRAS